MTNSFYNGVSGIKTQSVGVDVVANNMANVNTIGFKRTGSEFADIFYRRVASQSSNPTESGGGAMVSATKVVYEQSGFMDGESEFDVALNGKGFFGVMGYNKLYYTRNGEFVRDANDNLVDSSGNYVLGIMNPNLTSITYSDRVAEEMGRINGTPVSSGYTINNPSQSFAITRSTQPTSLFVPRNLYYFPEVTTAVNFRGTIYAGATTTTRRDSVDTNGVATFTPQTNSLTLSGTINAATAGAVAGAVVSMVLKDKDGKTFNAQATLDNNLNFTNTITPADFDMESAVVESAIIGTTTLTATELPTITKNSTMATLSGSGANLKEKKNNNDNTEAKAVEAKAGDRVVVTLVDGNGNRYTTDELTLDNDLKFNAELSQTLTGLNLNNATIESITLVAERETYEDKSFGARIYNADGSISTLKYNLQLVTPRADGENYVYNITAGVYNASGELVGSESTGTMTFNQYGALIGNTLPSVPNPNGGTISVNFGTPTDSPSTNGTGAGWDGVYIGRNTTQDAIDTTQNGVAEGFFSRYQIENDGSIMAQFTNGRVVTIGKLALYNFINEQGLASLGSNNFIATSNSGPASFLFDADGNFVYTAQFAGKRLELSNVDLSTELTNLIVMQRAFEASSKSVTTSDDMIETAIGLKK